MTKRSPSVTKNSCSSVTWPTSPTSAWWPPKRKVKNNREPVRRTIAALFDSVAWLRANRAESSKMIVDKFKVNQAEAENTYATLIKLLNKDGRLNPKVARGYLDLLRQERPIPADFDIQKAVDFSMLPPVR